MSNTLKTIEILISPTGETTVQTKGFAGSSCRDASRAIEQALGLVQSDSPTAEMYQTQSVNQPLPQGNS
jgi:hypothetical protein